MRLRDYQRAAKATDQFPKRASAPSGNPEKAELVPLLGLTGEVGVLLSEYKKLLRDGPVHLKFRDRVAEELGDTLWYISTVASKFDLSLDTIARANLRKVKDRWSASRRPSAFDDRFPTSERLPRRFQYRLAYEQ